jgi:O-methyltransferase involved in polyketide biosynthesis
VSTHTDKVDFTGVPWGSVEWTNLVTLYLRACESRLPQPILGDDAAAEAVDRIDYDFKRMHRTARPGSNQYLVALRAKKTDNIASAPVPADVCDAVPQLRRAEPLRVLGRLRCAIDVNAQR